MRKIPYMAKFEKLDDDKLREYTIMYHNGTLEKKYRDAVWHEMSKRILKRVTLLDVDEQWDIIKGINDTLEYWRLCYDTPYSLVINGEMKWFSSLEKAYYALTGDKSWYKARHLYYTEAEWWYGYGHPTPFSQWCSERGIKL